MAANGSAGGVAAVKMIYGFIVAYEDLRSLSVCEGECVVLVWSMCVGSDPFHRRLCCSRALQQGRLIKVVLGPQRSRCHVPMSLSGSKAPPAAPQKNCSQLRMSSLKTSHNNIININVTSYAHFHMK